MVWGENIVGCLIYQIVWHVIEVNAKSNSYFGAITEPRWFGSGSKLSYYDEARQGKAAPSVRLHDARTSTVSIDSTLIS